MQNEREMCWNATWNAFRNHMKFYAIVWFRTQYGQINAGSGQAGIAIPMEVVLGIPSRTHATHG